MPFDSKVSGLTQPLREQLKAKSRARRDALKRAAAAGATPRTMRNDLAPALELVLRPIADLVVPARNVRSLDAAHVREVANSIATLGFCVPVVIDGDNRVLDGVVRVEAARSSGLSTISCIVATHLTVAERRLLRVAVNRLQEKGEWDLGSLKLEFEDLILEEAAIEISGFTGTEIDQVILCDEAEAFEEGQLAPPADGVPVARLGDIFLLGEHQVICGDATDLAILARIMGAETARLVLTDVPYNVKIARHVTSRAHREFPMASGEMTDDEFLAFNSAWMAACAAHVGPGGLLGTFIDWRGYPTVHAAATKYGLVALNLVVWSKSNAGMGSLYRSQHELLPLYKVGTAPHINNVALGKSGRWRSNVWVYPGASTIGSEARQGIRDHPTVKPAAMLADALLDLTQRDDIVLDPFLGSGSMLIAAEKTGRRCRGVELDPLYVDVAVRRYETVTGRSAVLFGTDETFATLEANRGRESVPAPRTVSGSSRTRP